MKMDMSKWIYQGQYLEEPPLDTFGFIYRISFGEKYYLGCKSFWSTTNGKISKKRSTEIYKGRGKKPGREKVTKESNWRIYNSSSTIVKQLISEHGEDKFRFEILGFYTTKTELLLAEAQEIINHACDPNLLNGWVKLCIYFKNLNCE